MTAPNQPKEPPLRGFDQEIKYLRARLANVDHLIQALRAYQHYHPEPPAPRPRKKATSLARAQSER